LAVNNLQTDVSKVKEHDHKDGKIAVPINGSAPKGLGSVTGLAFDVIISPK
jgi:hypothetical protein